MYTAAAGMAAQQQRLDALSNDVANVNTIGYKRLRVAFRDLVYTPTGPGGQAGVMEGSGAAATLIGRGRTGAALKSTGEPLDVAIQGPGHLQVRRPDGTTALTRDGQLSIDSERRLCSAGNPLQPPVRVPQGVSESDIKIAPDGQLSSSAGAFGRIELVAVASPDRLQAIGGNLFVTNADSGAPGRAGADTTLAQGVLETSDVDMGDAMADMMIAQRAYTLASRAISMQDQMAQIANGVKR
ncbi:MAG TPA: flagellar hook-basal body complex protein [Capillimicrobium sp.]